MMGREGGTGKGEGNVLARRLHPHIVGADV